MAVCYKSVLAGGGSGSGGIHVDTLTITTQPTTKTYVQGEAIDTTGMVVTASASGMSGTVTQYVTVSPQIMSTAGTQTVTVSYGDATATYEVTVYAVESIAITTQPTITNYVQGDELDLTGVVVTATAGTLTRNFTNKCTFSPADGSTLSTAGTITVTASYNGLSTSTTVTSNAIDSIDITTQPTTTEYIVDDTLDLTGMVVTLTAGNITRNITNDCTYNPTNGSVISTSGSITITATYREFTDTTTVMSYDLTSIAVTTLPTKETYSIDDQLDLTGIVVTAYASPSALSKIVTSDCIFNPTNGTVLNTEGSHTITVIYGSFSTTFDVTVSSANAIYGI